MPKDSREPVSRDEAVFRRILNHPNYLKLELLRPVQMVSFRPTDNDHDGISVYRLACGATANMVAAGNNAKGYYVAVMRVADIVDLEVDGMHPTVVPTPKPNQTPGHASIPELNVQLRDGNAEKYRKLASKLAGLITLEDIVFRPEGDSKSS